MDDSRPNSICGIVDGVTFRKEESGFTVLDLEWGDELVTVVGTLPEVFAGERLTVTGCWQTHPTFGEQFRADSFERDMPSGASAILRYLSSGGIKGIGPSTAAKVVEKFGDDTLYVIENEPERLALIKGISQKKAAQIAEEYRAHYGLSEIITFLAEYGVTANEALLVWKRWGAAARDMISENPYVLCAPELGIGFDRIDAAAAALERAADDDSRIYAGIFHVIRHNLGNGHTCLPRKKLVPTACSLLGQPPDAVNDQLDMAIDCGELVSDTLRGEQFIFLPEQYAAETYCAGRISTMLQYPPPPVTGYWRQVEINEKITGISYEEVQKQAIAAAMEKGMLVLTGGPGTGKTTTLNAIIDVLEASGSKVAIAAPTGRAAKRITEVTGREAKTIHRLLEVEWGMYDLPSFHRNEKNPLECDALIVDELSMTDTLLFENLLRALKLGSRLVLVGDSDQLPSVGAGNVLGDLISSGRVPVIHLHEVFRQSKQSAIVTNAHKIVAGELPDLNVRDSDFFFLPAGDASSAAKLIEDLCFRRLPAAYGYNPLTDIQVLCPGKKGTVGTRELNKRLQQRINPPHATRHEARFPGVVFREGDKVMQIRNNYDVEWQRDDSQTGQGVFNGDIGILKKIDRFDGRMTVRFDDRTAVYDQSMSNELEHAYAITVHKSQGSEFEAVIIPVLPGPSQLCYRNLLYTAVTRAKSLLILVGQSEVVADMVNGVRKTGRYTALAQFLLKDKNSEEGVYQ